MPKHTDSEPLWNSVRDMTLYHTASTIIATSTVTTSTTVTNTTFTATQLTNRKRAVDAKAHTAALRATDIAAVAAQAANNGAPASNSALHTLFAKQASSSVGSVCSCIEAPKPSKTITVTPTTTKSLTKTRTSTYTPPQSKEKKGIMRPEFFGNETRVGRIA